MFGSWLDHMTTGRVGRAVTTVHRVFELNKFKNILVQKEPEVCLDRPSVGFARS